MSRIELLPEETAGPLINETLVRLGSEPGSATNMKRTLAHSPVALQALLEWYPLYHRVEGFLNHRETTLFTHAISAQSDCLVCSSFFRRWLIEAGEDPDNLQLNDREAALVAFGRQLAANSNNVDDALFAQLAAFLTPQQLVELVAFGTLMLATNVFNNVLRVPLDSYLEPFRRPEPAEVSHA
jgi:alkylhydroperoxidase family enzyme